MPAGDGPVIADTTQGLFSESSLQVLGLPSLEELGNEWSDSPEGICYV